MGDNYIFSLQPTFTQGLILGQLSVLALLVLIFKYLFLESAENPFETSSYQPRIDTNRPHKDSTVVASSTDAEEVKTGVESAEWFNALLQQVVDVYRSKLRGDLSGPEGDEIARQRVEDYANRIRPVSFLDYVTVHSVDLGVSAPRLHRVRPSQKSKASPLGTDFDATYTDSISLSLSTSYLFNYPMASFARLPISLTISLSEFKSMINILPPSTGSPALTISVPPTFTLDLTTTSLMGSRAKLANVPKLHELIEHQVRRVLLSRGTWKVVLPGLSGVAEVQKELLGLGQTTMDG